MTDGTKTPQGGRERSEEVADQWEWWVRSACVLFGVFVVAWLVVLLRLGTPSIYVQIFGLPVLGGLSLPISLWGVIKTVFNPPVIRKSRAIGFALVLAIGFFGAVPMFPVPLATADWSTEVEFRLPFEREWETLAGGPSLSRNYHATTAAYRWGYDFAPTQEGKRYENDGESLQEFYCYGEPIVAPAAGKVVRFENDLKDFEPRDFSETSVLGNHVVLRVEPGVFLYAAHLKKGSVPLQAGDRVEKGAKIGECGNSGRAVEPHLHIHLQDRLSFPVAQSLPLRFSNYVADGESVEVGMPLGKTGEPGSRGQMVGPGD